MKNEHEVIKLEAIELVEGQSKRIVCPFCNGGSTKEKSLAITRREDGLVYFCFRDTCHAKGGAGSKGTSEYSTVSKAVEKKGNPFIGATHLLDNASRKFLMNKFYLSQEDIREFRLTSERDILMPIRDWHGRRYGVVNRRYAGLNGTSRVPKTINYFDEPPEHTLHFETPVTDTKVALVEDIVSAKRVAKYMPCIALLGTHLADGTAVLLRDLGITDVVILLDADANKSSRKLADRHQFIFDNIYPIQRKNVKLDPKDCTPDELKYIMDTVDHVTSGGSFV